MLKTSDYNFIWPIENSENAVIYNSFTGAAMEINKEYLVYLEKNDPLDPAQLDEKQRAIVIALETNGFLIDADIYEKKILKYRYNKEKFNRETLTLTILPTFRCNLRCFYCFEDRTRTELMTPQIQEGVLQYVLKSLAGVNNIHVCWFGGEPLMAWKIICTMSEKLMKIAEDNNCTYSARMISNGYLLDEDKIARLKEIGINSIQITLDGPPAMHSLRKSIKGDPETNFNFIIDKIKKLIDAKIKVKIRVNIDKKNLNAVDELLELLAKAGLQEAYIYPAMIEPYTKLCSDIENNCLHRDEFAEIETWFNKLLLEKGLRKDLSEVLPAPKGNFCISDQINAVSIAPDGYVYKCWNTIGSRDAVLADVMDREEDESENKKRNMRIIEDLTWDPFEKQECTSCKLLPVCMGGCPYQSKTSGDNIPYCLTIKDTIRENVINHVFSMKINRLFQW